MQRIGWNNNIISGCNGCVVEFLSGNKKTINDGEHHRHDGGKSVFVPFEKFKSVSEGISANHSRVGSNLSCALSDIIKGTRWGRNYCRPLGYGRRCQKLVWLHKKNLLSII